ncbi:MAG: hypothetical protein V7K35_10005 [Nostoc sp.]|uniref:hypothetical protein n=1 Tax=Nostoc sp. TaxID=1180 RepID=UPI002FFA2FF4
MTVFCNFTFLNPLIHPINSPTAHPPIDEVTLTNDSRSVARTYYMATPTSKKDIFQNYSPSGDGLVERCALGELLTRRKLNDKL